MNLQELESPLGDTSVEVLQDLYRSERETLEAYDTARERLGDIGSIRVLDRLRQVHDTRSGTLRETLLRHTQDPDGDPGLAHAVNRVRIAASGVLGDEAVVKSLLKNADERSLETYESVLERPGLPQPLRRFAEHCRDEEEQHLAVLRDRESALATGGGAPEQSPNGRIRFDNV